MLICQVQQALIEVVEIGHHKSDPQLKELFAKLGPLIEKDRKKGGALGFPDLNKISSKTMAILEKINERCDQAYDYVIL